LLRETGFQFHRARELAARMERGMSGEPRINYWSRVARRSVETGAQRPPAQRTKLLRGGRTAPSRALRLIGQYTRAMAHTWLGTAWCAAIDLGRGGLAPAEGNAHLEAITTGCAE